MMRHTRLRRVSKKRAKHRASAEGKAGLAYMRAVKGLPCCICGAAPPSEAHHVICGRYSTRKASDFDTIPLCAWCHRIGPESVHNAKASFEARHGPDHAFVPLTRAKLGEPHEIDF